MKKISIFLSICLIILFISGCGHTVYTSSNGIGL